MKSCKNCQHYEAANILNGRFGFCNHPVPAAYEQATNSPLPPGTVGCGQDKEIAAKCNFYTGEA